MTTFNNKVKSNTKLILNLVFIGMITCSVTMTYLFYKAWNNPSLAAPEISESKLDFFSVDSCVFGDKDIFIRGWAYIKGNKNILNRIFAFKNNGGTVEIMASTQERKDVSNAFNAGDLYNKSGFLASRRDHSASTEFTRDIMIVSIDEKGVGHATKYHCK